MSDLPRKGREAETPDSKKHLEAEKPDPKKDLETKQKALADLEKQIDTLNAQAGDLRDQARKLTQSLDEQDRLADAYTSGVKKISKSTQDIADYVELVRPKVEADIKPNKDKIEKTIAAEQQKIDDLSAEVKKLQKAMDDANSALKKAQANETSSGQKLASMRNMPQTLTGKLTEATALKGAIAETIAAKNNAGAYFLLGEYDALAQQISDATFKKDEYRKAVADCQTEVQEAAANVKAKTDAAAKAKSDYDAKNKEASQAAGNRRKTIVDSLKPLNKVAAA